MTNRISGRLALARKIAFGMYPEPEHHWERVHACQGALAAVIETTERIERLLDKCNDPCPQCHDALRNQENLK